MGLLFVTAAFAAKPVKRAKAYLKSERIKVMIVDTGVTPHALIAPYLQKGYQNDKTDYIDESAYANNDAFSHGTHIAGIILYGNQEDHPTPVCSQVEVYSCAFYSPGRNGNNIENTKRCFVKALVLGMSYVNYSAGGGEPSDDEHLILRALSDRGTKIVVAAGNEEVSYKYHKYYPAMYNSEDPFMENVIPVANLTNDGNRTKSSSFDGGMIFDYGTHIKSTYGFNKYSYMTGTSQAAAMYTHRLLLRKCEQIKNKH